MKPLLVGEAPGTYVEGGEPLTGRIASTISSLLGITVEEYLERYDRANLFDREIEGKWPWSEARHSAAEIRDALDTRASGVVRVVLLGVRVADAFEMLDSPLYVWRPMPGLKVANAVRVPHPSGRNRLLNEGHHRGAFRSSLDAAWRMTRT